MTSDPSILGLYLSSQGPWEVVEGINCLGPATEALKTVLDIKTSSLEAAGVDTNWLVGWVVVNGG